MLVKVQCPSCGANMEIDDNLERLRCKYCGFEIVNLTDRKEVKQTINVSGTVRHVYADERPAAPEKKPDDRWKKVLSKGAFVVSCIVIAILLIGGAAYLTLRLMRGCRSGGTTTGPTPTPEPTPIPSHTVFLKTLEEAPPIEKLGLNDGHLEEYSEDLLIPENWLDMTRDDTEGFRIIRSVVLGCSYLVMDGEYYRLGEGEDGKGLLDYCVTDLDFDDEPDLLYTYHYGADDDSYSKVGWFNFATHENVMSDFSQKNGYLAIVPEDGNYILCRADRFVDPDTFCFGLTVTERLGSLIEIGKIVETGGSIAVIDQITLILDAPETPVPTPQ